MEINGSGLEELLPDSSLTHHIQRNMIYHPRRDERKAHKYMKQLSNI